MRTSELIVRVRGGEVPILDTFVTALGRSLPTLAALRDTPQDPEWHAEGDVHVHTDMVLDEVRTCLSGAGAYLSADARERLVWAAALHDVAKAVTTREMELDGHLRVVAPGHAERGRSMVLGELLGAGLAPELALDVAELVGAHHDPKLLVVRDRPDAAYAALAGRACPELLYWLELADMRGRRCPDQDEQVEYIELYRAGAEMAGAFTTRAPLAAWEATVRRELDGASERAVEATLAGVLADGVTGKVHSAEEGLARHYDRRDDAPWVTMLIGPSGSGKSTYTEVLAEGADVVSLDALRVELTGRRDDFSMNGQVVQAAKERLREGLRAGRDVVWDATNLQGDRRLPIVGLARNYGANVRFVAVVGSAAELRDRNARREHPVPPSVLERQIAKYDVPWGDEADVVELHAVDGMLLRRFVGGFAAE